MRRRQNPNRYAFFDLHNRAYRSYALDMYTPVFGHSPLIDGLLFQLRRKIEAELKFQNELTQVRGALDMILSASILSTITPSSLPQN